MRAINLPRATHRDLARLQLTARALSARLETLLIPVTTPHEQETPDDYRRVVTSIALAAVGFFLPALVIADVPLHLWLPFSGLALAAGLLLGGSFILVPRGSVLVPPWVFVNVLSVAVLATAYRPYFHQIGLLYALLVAAHSVVHGLGPGVLAVLFGMFLVPMVIQAPGVWNGTDPIYAGIYLLGIALIPWVASRLANGRLVEVRRNLKAVLETEREAVLMLARAAEAKDDITGDHVLRVGELSARLALAVGESAAFAEDLRFAGMLHDVGKLHVPDHILMKPGQLTPDEWAIVRQHPIWGERILGSTAGFELSRVVARSHHENWNGTGYPDGLITAEIPLAARIVHLADVFDALLRERPYKAAWPVARCLAELERQSGRMFDPDLVEAFIRIAEAGSFVRVAGAPADASRMGFGVSRAGPEAVAPRVREPHDPGRAAAR